MAEERGKEAFMDQLLPSEDMRETETVMESSSPVEEGGAATQQDLGESQQQQQPLTNGSTSPDRTIVRGIFLLLGIGILAPWNAFISAKDYFDKRLCDETHNLESKFSLIYNLASVASLGLLIAIQTLKDQKRPNRQSTSEQDGVLLTDGSNRNKEHSFYMVMLPLSLYLVAFLGQALMVRILSMPFFLSLTFLGLAVCGMACSVAQAGIVATAGLFPSNIAMNPYLEGMSLGGVAVSMANFVSAIYGDQSIFWDSHCNDDRILETCDAYKRVDEAVFVYFFLGSAILGLCMIGFAYIVRKQHDDTNGSYDYIAQTSADHLPSTSAEEPSPSVPGADDEPLQPMENSENDTSDVWRETKGPAFCIFLVFALTLSLFPAWTSQIRSAHQCRSSWRMTNDLFTPMSFVLFNVGDLAGRLLSSRVAFSTYQHRSSSLVKAAWLRFLFLILFFFCPGGKHPTAIESDLYTWAVLLSFAVSNGYLLSTAFCHAPSLLAPIPEQQERMAEILNFSVALGLLVGSLLSFPVAAFMSG